MTPEELEQRKIKSHQRDLITMNAIALESSLEEMERVFVDYIKATFSKEDLKAFIQEMRCKNLYQIALNELRGGINRF